MKRKNKSRACDRSAYYVLTIHFLGDSDELYGLITACLHTLSTMNKALKCKDGNPLLPLSPPSSPFRHSPLAMSCKPFCQFKRRLFNKTDIKYYIASYMIFQVLAAQWNVRVCTSARLSLISTVQKTAILTLSLFVRSCIWLYVCWYRLDTNYGQTENLNINLVGSFLPHALLFVVFVVAVNATSSIERERKSKRTNEMTLSTKWLLFFLSFCSLALCHCYMWKCKYLQNVKSIKQNNILTEQSEHGTENRSTISIAL